MTLSSGTRLGPYEIVTLIGAGGMGEVYKARDTRLQRDVAVKVLPAEFSQNSDRRARFEREARAIAALSHPHICTVYDVGHQGELDFLVLEYLDGETLAARLERSAARTPATSRSAGSTPSPAAPRTPGSGADALPRHIHALPIDETMRIATQLAAALAAAHKAGITHRDLKPGNVMLTKAGTKVLDFGLAKARPERPPGHSSVASEGGATTATGAPLTEAGVLLGTLPYMAPEQVEGHEADARSDIFAFGAIVYEMATGTRAFEGNSQASLIAAILERQPPPISARQPLAPAGLDRLVTRCLAKDPDERLQSALDLLHELQDLRDGQRPSRVEPGLPVSAVQPLLGRSRRRVALGVSAAALLFLIGVSLTVLNVGDVRDRLTRRGTSPVIRSLAVLPLQNLTGDPQQDYFVDGLHDALISALAQIPGLRVISRTSVAQYKETRKPIPEIARELQNVDGVMEGTVLREGERVAITLQLIEATTDRHLWSRNYVRQLRDILALREEVARAVAAEISVTLTPAKPGHVAVARSLNPEAYDYYLRGNDHYRRGAIEKEVRLAVNAYEKATELDPQFALGLAALSEAHARIWWYHWDRGRERVAQAKAAVDRALQVQPDLPEVHRALGYYYYWCELDYERALQEFDIVQKANPSDAWALSGSAFVKRRQGKVTEALTQLLKIVEVDPQSPDIFFNIGETYALLRRPVEADRFFDRALRLNPNYDRAYAYKIRLRLRLRPAIQEAKEILEQAEGAGLRQNALIQYHATLLEIHAGEYNAALKRLAGLPFDTFQDQFWFMPTSLLAAVVYELEKQPGQAREQYDLSRQLIESRLQDEPGEARFHSALGLAMAGLGRREAAIREGKLGVALLPRRLDAYRAFYRLEDLARIYVMLGDFDTAIRQLDELLGMPGDLGASSLLMDPLWSRLRTRPEFEDLVRRHGAS